jgi:hypothetical protein
MSEPQGTQQQGSSKTDAGDKAAKKMSQDQMVKEAGFRNFPQFLLSYGLKIYNPGDVEEGKAILNALFEHQG